MYLQKEDPLKRIQEEINEVARRERELRNAINSENSGNVEDHQTNLDTISGLSDDSGISSSSSPINGTSSNVKDTATTLNNISNEKNIAFNRSHTINPTSVHQHIPLTKLTRALSTPQIFMPASKRFNGQKGIMQRFIASRGKFSPGSNRPKDSLLVSPIYDKKFRFQASYIIY